MSKLRANQLTDKASTGAPTAPNGLVVTGVTTSTTFSGSGASLTNIPDSAIATLTASKLTGALPAISGANLTGVVAISSAQQFRLAANQSGSGSNGTVLTNWEEVDTNYQAIGSNWSQSNGVFSCSATGIYLCFWGLVVYNTTTGDAYDPNIQLSTDSGSNFSTRSRAWTQISASSAIQRAHVQNQFIFDVSNAGTFRLRFRQSQDNDIASGTSIGGSSSESLTNIMFIRLGNT
tara:strand:+ start:500 stop:1201 length:702 start_codon:yes stop_codon:yes gene_type:complete